MKYKLKNNWIYLFVIGVFLSSNPYFTWQMNLAPFYFLCCCLFPLWSIRGIAKAPLQRKLSILLIAVFYIYSAFNQYLGANIVGIIFTMSLLGIYLIKDKNWTRIYDIYVTLYSVILIPSIIVFILVQFVGISLPYNIIEPLVEMKKHVYYQYPFCVIPSTIASAFRFESIFDEPGVVGTISAVLLVTNKFDFKDWRNWSIAIAGVLSLSMFFFGIVFIYILMFAPLRTKFIAVLFISILGVLIYNFDKDILQSLVFDRFVFEDGQFAGSNRTATGFDNWYERYLQSDKALLGYGKGYCSAVQNIGGASYKNLVVDAGIPMFFIFCLGFLLYYTSVLTKRKQRKDLVLMLILAAGVVFQRPFIYELFYVFLIVAPVHALNNKTL